MKKPIATGALLLLFFIAAAQQPELRMTPAVKSVWDSLQKVHKDLPQVTVAVPRMHFESRGWQPGKINEQEIPGYVAKLDRVYIARPDNMPVLVPNINRLEKMPGSHRYKVAPPSNMPNPLYPKKKPGQ